MSYLTLDTESEDEHGERYGEDPITVEWNPDQLWDVEIDSPGSWRPLGLALTLEEAEAKRVALEETGQIGRLVKSASTAKKLVATTLVCSCGSETCFAIRSFGLPRPLFHSAIEPLRSQHVRDSAALKIKAAL